MKIVEINKKTIEEAGEIIKKGGLVVYPSDTVYILAVDPTNKKGVEKLLAFKERWTGKAISVAVTNKKMAMDFVKLSPGAETIYANLLPGPFTIVSEGKHKTEKGIEAENGTLGIRIPECKYIYELVKILKKPVTATSANLSGRTPHYSIESFLKTLSKKKKEMIDLVVDAGKLPRNKPSTVIDTTEPEIRILRRGDLIVGKSKKLISKSVRETEKVAEFLTSKSLSPSGLLPLKKGREKALIFLLSGELGCGKTVFSRAVGKYLGVKEKITSPTFVIYNEYKIPLNPPLKKGGNGAKFLHVDLYRLKDEYEYEEIKFFEQFTEKTIACVEWPENMGEKNLKRLQKMCRVINVNFEYKGEKEREISYSV